MKKILLLLLIVASTCFGVSHKVLIIGQSNAQGLGPAPFTVRAYDKIFAWHGSWSLIVEPSSTQEPFALDSCSFATAMGNQICKYTGDTVYILNTAIGGTGLYAGSVRLWSARGAGTLYQVTLDSCSHASFVPDVITWFQGESDKYVNVDSSNYRKTLDTLVNNFRTYFSNPNLPFIAAKWKYYLLADCDTSGTIRAIAAWGATGNCNNRLITGFEYLTVKWDQAHYTTRSYEVIGRRFANSYLRWIQSCK